MTEAHDIGFWPQFVSLETLLGGAPELDDVPGAYLPPPIIHPLDLAALAQRQTSPACPLCGQHVEYVTCDAPYRVERDGDGNASWFEPGEGPGDIECLWRFEPCRCEGRELLGAST